ncbi:hypothetical protein EMCRGX_G009201 [Ephydatia muelleri]
MRSLVPRMAPPPPPPRYIEKCQQQCPGYNCAFLNVRVPSAGRYIKGSVAKQLMGISNQHFVFLDEKSKNGQDDLDEWAELDTQTFAMEPPKDSASSPSSAESGELVQDAAVVSPVATPPDPNITTTTTSLSTSHTTNGRVEGKGLSRENLEDNGPISDPSLAMFCNCPPDPALPRTMDLQILKRLEMAVLKEVLKCTEEVAGQMTLIDHDVYHMMSCDPHDDNTTPLFSTTMQDLCTGATSEGQYGPQATVPEEFKDIRTEPSVQLISLVSGAIRDRHEEEKSDGGEGGGREEGERGRKREEGGREGRKRRDERRGKEEGEKGGEERWGGKQCLEFNNYSSVMAVVVAGLGSAPIRRLHKTWEDLTFICDGNPDYLRGGLINVHKRRQVYSKVEEIKRLQRDAYNFQPVLELQNYFTQYCLTPDDELHSLSHELEPKMVVHRCATRSRFSTNLSSTTPNFSFFKPNSKHLSTTTLRA